MQAAHALGPGEVPTAPVARAKPRLISVLDDLPLRRKLQIAYVLFLLPIAFLIHTLVVGARGEIDRMQRERDGNHAIEAVRQLQHTHATPDSGPRSAIVQGAYRAAEAYGDDSTVMRRLADLRAAEPGGGAAEIARRAAALISAVADASGLTLDTELPSYRMQDLITVHIPNVVTEIAVIARSGAAAEAAPAQQAGAMLAVYKLEFAFERLSTATAAAVATDPMRFADVAAAGTATREAVRAVATTLKPPRSEIDAAVQSLDVLARLASGHLDALLGQRIDQRQRELVNHSVVAFALFALGIVYVVLVERRVVGPLAGLTRALHALAEGRVETRIVPSERRDEVGAIARGARAFQHSLEIAGELKATASTAQQRLAAAIDRLSDFVALFDRDDRLVIANTAYSSTTPTVAAVVRPGASFEQVARAIAHSGTVAAAHGREEAWFQERLAAYRAAAEPIEYRRTDGRWLLVHDHRLPDGGTLVVGTNITRLKDAMARAEREHARLVDAIESLPAVFHLFDRQERLVLTNIKAAMPASPEAGNLMVPGASAEAILRYMADHRVMADAVGREEAWIAQRLASFRSGDADFIEQSSDGRWFRMIQRRTREGGAISIRVDITRETLAERDAVEKQRHLSAILDNAPLAIYLKDRDGRYLLNNRCHADWFVPAGQSIVGLRVADFLPADEAGQPMETDREILRTGRPMVYERSRLKPESPVKQMLVTKFPIVEADGGISGVAGFIMDITASKAMELRLMQAHRLEAMGQITGGVAHDFNNILAAILMNLELAQHAARGDAELTERLQAASRATIRGRSLTQQLLAVAGRQALLPKPVDIDALFADMARLLEASVGQTVRLAFDVAADVGHVLADPGSLESAVLNLVINARDASPEGSTVTVAARAAGDSVAVSVRDAGSGMSPEVVARAAEPFFTTKPPGKGTGLGLSMVFGFARQSGGRVTIDTSAGHGTTVTIYLPRPDAAAAVAGDAEPARAATRSGVHILLVEDDGDVRQALSERLKRSGFRVSEAAGASEALACFDAAADIGLVVTDIVMPGAMNGVQLAEALRERRPGLPTVFMSGFAGSEETMRRAMALGCPILAKPFTDAELTAAIAATLHARDGAP